MDRHRKLLTTSSGFSLFEVMVAITLFSVFIATFIMSQGHNVTDSMIIREETTMLQLAQSIMNQTLVFPPEFSDSLNNSVTDKSFQSPFQKYRYRIEFKRLEVPDLSAFMGLDNQQQQNQMGAGGPGMAMQDQDDNLQDRMFEIIKRNLEQMLWQVKVTVTNKENNMQFSLSTWIRDYERRIDSSGI